MGGLILREICRQNCFILIIFLLVIYIAPYNPLIIITFSTLFKKILVSPSLSASLSLSNTQTHTNVPLNNNENRANKLHAQLDRGGTIASDLTSQGFKRAKAGDDLWRRIRKDGGHHQQGHLPRPNNPFFRLLPLDKQIIHHLKTKNQKSR